MKEPIALWKRASLFKDVGVHELANLYNAFTEEVFYDGDFLVREGEIGNKFYIISSGKVDILKEGVLIAQKGESDYFGVMALFDNSRRSADVRANGKLIVMSTTYQFLEAQTSDVVYKKILSNHFRVIQNTVRNMNESAVLKQPEKLELTNAIEELRNKISADLHDEVGSILAGIAMQTELMTLSSTNQNAEKISNLSRKAMANLRDIVWAMDSKSNKYENLLDRMYSFAEDCLDPNQMTFQFDTKLLDKSEAIPERIKKNIFLIYKEAITNISKHSNGNLVKIVFQTANDKLLLSIRDNGSPAASLNKGGLGLSNMRLRAQTLSGKFEVRTSDGFEVMVVVPL